MNTALALSSALTLSLSYIYWLHHRLDHATHRLTREGLVAAQSVSLDNLETIDNNQVFGSGRYFSVYERAWRVVQKTNLPGDAVLSKITATTEGQERYEEKLLTAYLRHTMVGFSRYLPQSYIMRLMAGFAERNKTFGAAHIQSLHFQEGDVVCGFYKVLLRRAGKVEFGIEVPNNQQNIEARLVIGICPSSDKEDEEVEVYSETVMWRPADRPDVVMPLERRVAKFMHELAAWWLLDSGVSYLVGLGVNKDV